MILIMNKYIPLNIEPKWQKKWVEAGLYAIDLDKAKKRYYLLVEFPYSSGDLHIGHWFAFGVTDIFGRFKRMQGFDVFFPVGFDAFGLPAENAAIQRGLHPKDWTLKNVETMSKQFKMMGAIHDWEHQVITCLPEYYKWNQWIFLKMLERGIAYKGKTLSNWCPVDQTVLADEQVVNGKCDRCGSDIEQKEIEQWFLKITEYADRLLWTKEETDLDWPRAIRDGQNDWIGKKEGINISYKIEATSEKVEVFTTRPDTNFGATFIALAPEHPLVSKITKEDQKQAVDEYVKQAGKKSQLERQENREKTGVFTGSYAINDLTGYKMPIWISDFVLMGFGTGALVGVPGHDKRDFEFATKFDLEIIRVVVGKDGDSSPITRIEQVQEEQGVMINSSFLDGLDIHEAIRKIMNYIEEKGYGKRTVTYHLHDWSISRQRYWGTPIPIINCPSCGPVPVPYEDLPVELPYEVDHRPKGKPPLATAQQWMKVKCPKCNGDAQREPETMDGFVDNSWYFYRYLSPKNPDHIFDQALARKWIPIDIYFGGAEHTLGHTMYSRFFTKFFYDIGLTQNDEYALKRFNHGVILGPDGARMSKSRGNVVNPDKQVKNYGADAVRMYLAFIGPYDIVAPWNPGGIGGVYHFLQRVWMLQQKLDQAATLNNKDLKIIHKTIKKVGVDVENLKFNTAIASLMEWLNHLSRKEKISTEEYKTLLLLLAPFAPHITEELWQIVHSLDLGVGHKKAAKKLNWSIHQQSWPKFDNKYLEEETFSMPVQVNGKVRDVLLIKFDILNNRSVIEKKAKESAKIKKFLAGETVKKIVYIPGKIINIVI